jgi:peptidoglycan/xylan/chitin deacetylase (PgdA/CDA1 family)
MDTMNPFRMVGWLGLIALTAAACVAEPEEEHDHDGVDISDEWNEVYDQAADGKADSLACSGLKVPDSSGFDGLVALTFDDGPNPVTSPQVLDTLKRHGITATFFINGMRVKGNAERAVLARILAEGHILANHSHEHKNLRKLSIPAVEEQVALTQRVIDAAGETRRYFRFPFGSAGCAAAELVRNDGYTITGWHVDTADWCFASSTGGVGHCAKSTFEYVPDSYRHDMAAFTLSQVRKYNGGIVLFHDIHQNTATQLDGIIQRMQSEGYTFVNIDDLDTFPRLNGLTPPFVGDACTGDGECAFDADASCALNADGGFCTLPCEGYCPDASGKASTFCASLDGGVTGSCVSKASDLNENCALVPGTRPQQASRFVGQSGAPASTATVCIP